MNYVDDLYLDWLIARLESPTPGLVQVCEMLHRESFNRRVGRDLNRADAGKELRQIYINDYHDANVDFTRTNEFFGRPCSWLEMLLALCEEIDYIYDTGVQNHLVEVLSNLGLEKVIFEYDPRYSQVDEEFVLASIHRVDSNMIGPNGHGGLYPLHKDWHTDQRDVEIWDQHAAYFNEKLEGELWTSM